MKIIHCSDIHLGAKIENKFSKEQSDKRKQELESSFARMVNYAKENNIQIILLTGDVFDVEVPTMRIKNLFYGIIESHSDIDFYYLRGNHDQSNPFMNKPLKNLKTFKEEDWTTYHYENVDISGIELTSQNALSYSSSLHLHPDKKNIVLLHGSVSDAEGPQQIKLSKLMEKNIDYLALGHYHSFKEYKIDYRGVAVYSGCLEGRGFDELGEKGFVVLDIEDTIKYHFVPFSTRTLEEISIDVSALDKAYLIYQKVKMELENHPTISKKDIIRIYLKGEIPFEMENIEEDVTNFLKNDHYFYIEVKDKTSRPMQINKYKDEISLKGEFVRIVLKSDLDDHIKQKILQLGLKTIDGKEIES